jgi:MFS family permease
MIIGNAIGEAADTYNLLLAARIVQGFSTSAYESLIVAAVGDVFFVHQRGLRISAITFILSAASNLASIIAGQVTTGLGWPWLFHLLQIFSCTQFVLMFFFCPETTYIRDHAYDIDQVTNEQFQELAEKEHRAAARKDQVHLDETVSNLESIPSGRTIPTKKTFTESLAVYTGVYSHESILKQFIGPFVTLLNTGACWTIVMTGLLNMWYVTTAIIQAGLFFGPPWFFDASQVGYLSTGPFVGGLLGSAVMVFTSDPVAKLMTRWNKGI